jgi:hypothetical protein
MNIRRILAAILVAVPVIIVYVVLCGLQLLKSLIDYASGKNWKWTWKLGDIEWG